MSVNWRPILQRRETPLRSEPLVEFALEHGFSIVSKDSDFQQRSFLHGPPPKVIWIRLGNCTTSEILEILTVKHREVLDFGDRPVEAFLVLGR